MIPAYLLVIAVWLIFLSLILFVFTSMYSSYKNSKGNKRIISGEITKDFGVAIMVSAAFKWGIQDFSYYAVVLLGAFMVGIGARMKIDGK